jgi:hypothetical protein
VRAPPTETTKTKQMKLSDLEDSDQVVTKDYLDAKLERLKSDLLQQLIASERGQRLWIWGLYGLVIVSFFVRR